MVTPVDPSFRQPYFHPDQNKPQGMQQSGGAPHQANAPVPASGPVPVQPTQQTEEHHGGGGHHAKGAERAIQPVNPGGKKLSRAQMRYSLAEATRKKVLADLKNQEKKIGEKGQEKGNQQNKQQQKKKPIPPKKPQ